MKNRYALHIAIFLAGLFAAGGPILAQTASRSPMLRLEAVPSKIYAGESFRLLIHLDNANADTPPATDYLSAEFDVEYLGPQSRNSSRVTIINGVTQKSEERGVTWNYRLTPKNAGTIEINGPDFELDGQKLSAAPITISVAEPNEQNLVRLELSADAQNVYPLSPFTVTLSIFVKELPGEFQHLDPIADLTAEVGPPSLSVDWADDQRLPAGLAPQKQWQEWLGGYQNHDGGFAVNNIQKGGGIFDFGWGFGDRRSNAALFLPAPERVERPDADGNASRWVRYDFARSFTAEKTGPITFDAAALKGTFAKPNADGKLEAEPIYALSNPLTVEIKDVPTENRPDDYIGAFGQFDFGVDLTPKKAKVGEAMTLTMTLRGKGSVLNVKAPNLETNPAVTERFKLYPPSEETAEGLVRWTWSLRPLQEGQLEFPPLSVSYFDVAQEKFKTLQSRAVALDISKSEALAPSGAPRAIVQPHSTPMERSPFGIFGNKPAPQGRMNRELSLAAWGTAAGIIGFGSLFLWCAIAGGRKLGETEKAQMTKRIQAGRVLLDEANQTSRNGDRSEWIAGLRQTQNAFLVPIAERFGVKPDTISGSEAKACFRAVAQSAGDEQAKNIVEQIIAMVDALEQIQYGFEPTDAEKISQWSDLYERWARLLTKIGPKRLPNAGRKPRHGSRRSAPLILLALSLALAGGCGSPADDRARQDFDEALRLFDEADAAVSKNHSPPTDENAQSSDENANAGFLQAAAVYEGLVQKGFRSGPIYFNQGNAYLRAGQPARAVAAWRKAQKFLPTDPYLKANIESTLPLRPSEKKPLLENILFWQNRCSQSVFGSISVVALALACLSELIRRFVRLPNRIAKTLRRFAWGTGIVFALFGLSFLYDYARYDLENHGILAVESPARKGASPQFEPLYRDPIPALTEFRVERRRGDWIEAQFADGQKGWLPESDTVVW